MGNPGTQTRERENLLKPGSPSLHSRFLHLAAGNLVVITETAAAIMRVGAACTLLCAIVLTLPSCIPSGKAKCSCHLSTRRRYSLSQSKKKMKFLLHPCLYKIFLYSVYFHDLHELPGLCGLVNLEPLCDPRLLPANPEASWTGAVKAYC